MLGEALVAPHLAGDGFVRDSMDCIAGDRPGIGGGGFRDAVDELTVVSDVFAADGLAGRDGGIEDVER